ncbi:PepSY-associated TM helix domain-containing protein [Desulfolithobacter sp.]
MDPKTRHLLRNLHRWFGLLLAGLVVFYCFTGLLLNHRKSFGYFIDKHRSITRVDQSDIRLMREFIEFYKNQIGRSDDPTVIRIRGGSTIEFLYGSHGRTTYIIDPARGTMEQIDKTPRQPWNYLNSLHKVFKTSTAWLVVADFACVTILLVTLTGLFMLRYRALDWVLVIGGALLLAVGVYLA